MRGLVSTKKLIVGALGLGCLAVFAFPVGSLGSVRQETDSNESAEPMARMRAPEMPQGEDMMPRLVIETTKHSLTLKLPGESPVVMKAQGAYALKRGTYTVTLKESEPLWQAPPTYFLRRGLKVPAEGSPERLMRGALGRQALFLDKRVAIHSGPIWNDDVGGLKLSSDDMARVFETITVGTKVEIR